MTTFPVGRRVEHDGDLYAYENTLAVQGFTAIAGVDEAGRGACAGPLVAAAVVLRSPVPGLADSKLLTPKARDRAFEALQDSDAVIEVISMSAADCDELGLHRANLTAMRRAIARLTPQPDYVLTDGYAVTGLTMESLAVWKGDRVSASIAAASVVAKVTRDRYMVQLHEQYPNFGFDRHKGYVTKVHDAALRDFGPCPEHRMSYANVKQALEVANT